MAQDAPAQDGSAWAEQAALALQAGDTAEASRLILEGLVFAPESGALWNLQGVALAQQGRIDAATAAFAKAAAVDTSDPEPLRNLGRILTAAADWTRVADVAEQLIRRAPQVGDGHRLKAWAELHLGLARLEQGGLTGWNEGEGRVLQTVHDAIVACLDTGIPGEALPWTVCPVLMRLVAHTVLDRVGSFSALGRRWATAGEHRVLLMQQARAAPTPAGRLELMAQHRLWGQWAEAAAAAEPVEASRPRGGDRIRLGFLSSDLRAHAVSAFAWPLFEYADPRFELYVYSFFPGPPDDRQAAIGECVHAYRHMPEAGDAEAAALIAADSLDVLIDLGGPTGWNRPQLMAHRLARVQMSWLGYAHSTGLSTIDHMVLDPHLIPSDPALLLENPLAMPASWIVLSDSHFREDPAPALEPPEVRNDFVTFGTANASYKYSPHGLDLWARVLAAVPGSRFLIVRPEAGAPAMREALLRGFAARGVGPERVRFEPVRGGHLPFYDQMDISLDTSPITGGTTTCESLWMGVPVVSLVGVAVHERLSGSILNTIGLGDLAVDSADRYVAAAVHLAGDRPRRAALRRGLRERIRQSPLWDRQGFARDFYALVADTIR